MLSVNYPQGFRVVMPYLWPAALLALALATLASMQRFALAPGFEFYLGPIFYLLAYRWFGLKAALVTAFVTMLSQTWLGVQPFSVLFAIGHVLVVKRFSAEDRGLSTITFFYQLVVGIVIALYLLVPANRLPVDIAALAVLRRILCETMLAALADMIALAVQFDLARGKVKRARNLSLQQSLEAIVSIAVAGAATLFMMGEFNHVNDRIELHQKDVAAAVRAFPDLSELETGQVHMLTMHGVDAPMAFIVERELEGDRAGRLLGCHRFDAGQAYPGDRGSMNYWLDMCYVVPLQLGQVAFVSPRSHVIALYHGVVRGLVPLFIFLTLSQLGLLLFGNSVRRTTRTLNQAVQSFGRSYVTSRPTAPFREADQLLGSFIAANNEFVAFERQRVHLMRAVEELRSAIDLKLLSDIRFDPDRNELRFAKLDPAMGRRGAVLAVHSGDVSHFASLAGQNEIMVEFRRGRESGDQWYLLLAREFDPDAGTWRYGCLIRLRTAKAFQAQMRHGARLMELGGMASALSHELRQPLFTISLAAENALLLLEKGETDTAKLRAKFGRIVEQVDRANAIIQRTSAYSRTERDERVAMELGLAVHNAVRFMRPLLTERQIHLHLTISPDLPVLMLPKVAIEQVIVNALQNAADSIDARREVEGLDVAGAIAVNVMNLADAIVLTVRDNGTGLDPAIRSSAFNAFCTTKPEGKGTGLGLFVCRQIMDEVGGTIAICDNPDAAGAILTLRFPATEGR